MSNFCESMGFTTSDMDLADSLVIKWLFNQPIWYSFLDTYPNTSICSAVFLFWVNLPDNKPASGFKYASCFTRYFRLPIDYDSLIGVDTTKHRICMKTTKKATLPMSTQQDEVELQLHGFAATFFRQPHRLTVIKVGDHHSQNRWFSHTLGCDWKWGNMAILGATWVC